jgi:hypothetical protein
VALRALVDGYAVAVDRRDRAAFVALFAPDAVLRVRRPDGSVRGERRGADELGAVTEAIARYDETLHLVSSHRVDLDGDAASGVAYCEAHHRTGAEVLVMAIAYEDRYVRAAGGWRFAERTVGVRWTDRRTVET